MTVLCQRPLDHVTMSSALSRSRWPQKREVFEEDSVSVRKEKEKKNRRNQVPTRKNKPRHRRHSYRKCVGLLLLENVMCCAQHHHVGEVVAQAQPPAQGAEEMGKTTLDKFTQR